MSAATQIYYTPFDSAFFKLPPEVRARIEAKVDEMGLRLKTFPHQRLTGHSVKVGVLVHPVRLACTGNPNGPSLYHLLEVIGKEKTMARIERGLKQMG